MRSSDGSLADGVEIAHEPFPKQDRYRKRNSFSVPEMQTSLGEPFFRKARYHGLLQAMRGVSCKSLTFFAKAQMLLLCNKAASHQLWPRV
ncbi:hypothetical protein [Roseovarius sp. SYSU LYC5161]|uniref:hypothetical protein n=1 Tax=Roseovarius halophilus (ex Wu et al. 2025) TaxID=3376060 RepID=UPI003999E945